MPRERTLSPGFFANHLLASCPPLTRLLFQGIWTLADFDGCFRWDPEGLAMKLLPRDQFDSVEALDLLERLGFIKSYEANSTKFGFIVNWHKYQDPHPGERPVFPKPLDDSTFHVRVKAPKYRSSIDLGFGRLDIQAGISQFQQVVSMLQAPCEKVVSNAFPSLPSLPSSPSLPTKETTPLPPKGEATPSAPLLPKPKRRNLASLDIIKKDSDRQAFQSLWEGWPKRSDGKPSRGSKPKAELCFQKILEAGEVSAAELVEAAIVYREEWSQVKEGWVQNVSTFLALEAGLWKQCVKTIRARSVEAM